MGRKSREKGKRGEREACDEMRSLWPDVRRRAMQARGAEGPDLDGTGEWWVEVGVGASVSPVAKYEQAKADRARIPEHANHRGEWVTPIALTKRDRGEFLVTMSAHDFRELVRRATTCGACRGLGTVDDPPFAADPKRVPCPKCSPVEKGGDKSGASLFDADDAHTRALRDK